MLLLTSVEDYETNKYVKASAYFAPDSVFFNGHFPGKPVLPGVILLEALAQAGAVMTLSAEGMQGRIAFLTGADNVKFRRQVLPGETVEFFVETTMITSRGGKGKGVATVNGQKCCEAEITYVFDKQTSAKN